MSPAHAFAKAAMRATGRGPWTAAEAADEMANARVCRWCRDPVIRNVPCGCDRAQEEARRCRAAG